MARQMKGRKESPLAQVAGAAMGIGAMYMMGKDKGLWGKPGAVGTTPAAESAALLDTQANALVTRERAARVNTELHADVDRLEAGGDGAGVLSPVSAAPQSVLNFPKASSITPVVRANSPANLGTAANTNAYAGGLDNASVGAFLSSGGSSASGRPVGDYLKAQDRAVLAGKQAGATHVGTGPAAGGMPGVGGGMMVSSKDTGIQPVAFPIDKNWPMMIPRADGGKVGGPSAGPIRSFPKKGK